VPAYNNTPLNLYFINDNGYAGDPADLDLFVYAPNPKYAAVLWRAHFTHRRLDREPARIFIVPTAPTIRTRALPWNDVESLVQVGGAS
jgi:hypothetical protein